MATAAHTFDSKSSAGMPLRTVYLANGGVALALAACGSDMPRIVHWGGEMGDPSSSRGLYDALHPQRVSGNLDITPFPSIMPVQSEAWGGKSRFVVRSQGIELFCKFDVTSFTADRAGRLVDNVSQQARTLAGFGDDELRSAQAQSSTYPDQAAVPHAVVVARDSEQGVELVWEIQVLDSGLVRQKAEVRNIGRAESGGPLSVQAVELGFPVPSAASEIMTATGHHLRERSPQRQPLVKGRFEKNSVMGRPDFDASLLMSAGTRGFGFEEGEIWSVHVGWSGNSTLSIDSTPFSLPVLGGGELLLGGEVELRASERYTTPWVYGSYGRGLNEVARRFHRTLRQLHPNLRSKPRPVILNTWEAVYFDHSFDTLKKLADTAQSCGVERFVVDDGWFGSRRDDTSGLGDWQVSEDVWPEGLRPLADYVRSRGMEFGLWFEPEMVNPDSRVARAHPDWILSPTPGRSAVQGRSQQVLDLTNPAALSYIFHAMDSLVSETGISYIKWDHNKLVSEAVSRHSGTPAVHNQTLAVYAIIEALKLRHPGLEIESCSSGGGRVDMGILAFCDRIWASDCVDPVERATIQQYTALLVPPEMIGEHIGASPAHSTRRATSLSMRAVTSLFGHLGVEWDLNAVGQDQLDELSSWISLYKNIRPLVAEGSLVQSDTNDDSVRVDGVVSADRSRGYFRFIQVSTSPNYPAAPVRLPGLDPDGSYRVYPLAASRDLSGTGNGEGPLYWWTPEGVTLSAQSLTNYGIRPPQLHPAQAVIFAAEKV